MSLRTKITILLSVFALFVVFAASACIYTLKINLENASTDFQRWSVRFGEVERLSSSLSGYAEDLEDAVRDSSALQNGRLLRSLTSVCHQLQMDRTTVAGEKEMAVWREIGGLGAQLEEQTRRIVGFIQETRTSEASELIERALKEDLIPAIRRQLQNVTPQYESYRLASTSNLEHSLNLIVWMTWGIFLAAAVLLLTGGRLIGHWLIEPIQDIREATARFSRGDLDYRLTPRSRDDLGRLCEALNEMAASLKEAHGRIKQAEKMEALGTLAGGISHDFNNLLTGAIGSLTLATERPDSAKLPGRLQSALKACWQAASLSRRLLRFSRGGHSRPRNLAFAEIVEIVLASYEEGYFDGIQIDREIDPNVGILMDKDELTQVLLNLISNARDAMPKGGVLGVAVRSEPRPGSSAFPPEMDAVLVVRDSGVGIPALHLDRIFEPFFTTKSRGDRRGTGLGLATVYAVVKSIGGRIDVQSREGEGTVIAIRFPLALPTPREAEGAGPPHTRPFVRGSILVVDDDPLVLQTCQDALVTLGHEVRVARTAREANEVMGAWRRDGAEVTALLDIDLPDGAGTDLAVEWRARDPNLTVILMTGYADKGIPPTLADVRYLHKPFSLEQLAQAL